MQFKKLFWLIILAIVIVVYREFLSDGDLMSWWYDFWRTL